MQGGENQIKKVNLRRPYHPYIRLEKWLDDCVWFSFTTLWVKLVLLENTSMGMCHPRGL